MKENTGAVHAQVPVDVATYLLNEKRAEFHSIEAAPQGQRRADSEHPPRNAELHGDAPEARGTESGRPAAAELRDGRDAGKTEADLPSAQTEPAPPRPEAAVKGITPAQPAPIVDHTPKAEAPHLRHPQQPSLPSSTRFSAGSNARQAQPRQPQPRHRRRTRRRTTVSVASVRSADSAAAVPTHSAAITNATSRAEIVPRSRHAAKAALKAVARNAAATANRVRHANPDRRVIRSTNNSAAMDNRVLRVRNAPISRPLLMPLEHRPSLASKHRAGEGGRRPRTPPSRRARWARSRRSWRTRSNSSAGRSSGNTANGINGRTRWR